MSLEELTKKYAPLVDPVFGGAEVTTCNHKPHPFMIGPQHFPEDGTAYIKPEQAPCAMKGCNLMLNKHTHDTVLCLKVTHDLTKDEARACLLKIKEELIADKIDGVAFVAAGGKIK